MSGGGKTTETNSGPPAFLQPYIEDALDQGQSLLSAGAPQAYSGNEVAGLTGLQQQGLQDQVNVAQNANAVNPAITANQQAMSLSNLDPNANPYAAGSALQASQLAQNQVNSQYGSAGANVASSLPAQQLAQSQAAASVYGNNYNNALNSINQATSQAPGLAAAAYVPGEQVLQAGTALQSQQQNQINAAMSQYNYNQQSPENLLSYYTGLLSGNGGNFQSQDSTASSSLNPVTAGLGAGTLLASGIQSLMPSSYSNSLGNYASQYGMTAADTVNPASIGLMNTTDFGDSLSDIGDLY